jgi:hypothetical protein
MPELPPSVSDADETVIVFFLFTKIAGEPSSWCSPFSVWLCVYLAISSDAAGSWSIA